MSTTCTVLHITVFSLGITCPAVDAPNNGGVIFDQLPNEFENYRFDTVATFSCFEGFGIEGTVTAVCEENGGSVLGVFLPERPFCEREFGFSNCMSSHSCIYYVT